jgi:4-alpha-glucanotransferase
VTVSGVPPDYFSETGQRWGTPLYRWDVLEKDGFSWWKRRLDQVLLHADIARLDHFRGFCGYWEIPAEEETAVNGVWRRGPGKNFLASMQRHFDDLPFVAEDLGVITDDVREAIHHFKLPGMHVLQFAFGGPDPARNTAAPHLHTARSVVYTGTHDNAPTRAWFATAPQFEREALSRYAGQTVSMDTATEQLTRLAFASVADWAVIPMQDALILGAEDRMNIPGQAVGNWGWRMRPEQTGADKLRWLTELAAIYGRLPLCETEPQAEEDVVYR